MAINPIGFTSSVVYTPPTAPPTPVQSHIQAFGADSLNIDPPPRPPDPPTDYEPYPTPTWTWKEKLLHVGRVTLLSSLLISGVGLVGTGIGAGVASLLGSSALTGAGIGTGILGSFMGLLIHRFARGPWESDYKKPYNTTGIALGSSMAGALLGGFLGGPPGALVGALIGGIPRLIEWFFL